MSGPLVSVVVTSYNHAEFLPQRLETLLAQTYRPLEIIVVDDASTDGSLSVLERYRSNPLVRVVASERNGGVAAASNRGAALARGEYLMFAECDDFDEPRHVERLVEALARSGAGVAYCRSRLVDEKGQPLGDDFARREPAFRALCESDAQIPRALMQRFLLRECVVPNMSAALMRRSAFEAAGGASTDYRLCLDWDLWNRLARAHDFYYVAEALNSFRTHATTARSRTALSRQIGEIYSVLTAAARPLELPAADRLRLRLGLARIWGGYFSQAPGAWLWGFPGAWLATLPHDPLSLLHLALAAVSRPLGWRWSLAEASLTPHSGFNIMFKS